MLLLPSLPDPAGSGSGLGFCRGYSFNMGDLITCGDVLLNYLEAYTAIPWDDLRYMFGEVFYGGHITDGMDRRCCTTYLEVWEGGRGKIRKGRGTRSAGSGKAHSPCNPKPVRAGRVYI
jgi:hypothetical protein